MVVEQEYGRPNIKTKVTTVERVKGCCKESYLQAKKNSKRADYAAKKTAEEERFSTIINRDDSRKEAFKIAKSNGLVG